MVLNDEVYVCEGGMNGTSTVRRRKIANRAAASSGQRHGRAPSLLRAVSGIALASLLLLGCNKAGSGDGSSGQGNANAASGDGTSGNAENGGLNAPSDSSLVDPMRRVETGRRIDAAIGAYRNSVESNNHFKIQEAGQKLRKQLTSMIGKEIDWPVPVVGIMPHAIVIDVSLGVEPHNPWDQHPRTHFLHLEDPLEISHVGDTLQIEFSDSFPSSKARDWERNHSVRILARIMGFEVSETVREVAIRIENARLVLDDGSEVRLSKKPETHEKSELSLKKYYDEKWNKYYDEIASAMNARTSDEALSSVKELSYLVTTLPFKDDKHRKEARQIVEEVEDAILKPPVDEDLLKGTVETNPNYWRTILPRLNRLSSFGPQEPEVPGPVIDPM